MTIFPVSVHSDTDRLRQKARHKAGLFYHGNEEYFQSLEATALATSVVVLLPPIS